jgi:predicted metal-dependent HD superfamily phosphohydrolase
MAGREPELNCLIVSEETQKGGIYCNEVRQKNNLKPVELCIINVIKINLNESNKISSSILRKEILSIISIEKIDKIYQSFKNLCIEFKINENNLISSFWNQILNNYTKKWRFYHNLNYLYDFIELYEKYNQLIEKEKKEFLLGIFYHNVIYVPSRNDNEKESIKLFDYFLKEIKGNIINKEKIVQIFPQNLIYKENDDFVNLFLDMKLYIMMNNLEIYQNKVRKEFCFMNDNEYNTKNMEYFSNIEKKDKLFQSKIFDEELRNSYIKKIQILKNNNY